MNKLKLDFLKSLIENDSINIKVQADDWKDAVKKTFIPLLEHQKINEKYIDGVIKSTIDHGPYYIICPGVAMPHASPEDGALGNGFSLITLEQPVFFDKEEVKLLIGFCANNNKTHLEVALPQVVAIFENNDIVSKLINAKNKIEVIEIIRSINYLKYLGGNKNE